jgi:dTDP-4-amino-4,6-dideoxygalactose transaminase
MEKIPFNRPYMSGKEIAYIEEAHCNGMLAGDGPFTKKCQSWLQEKSGSAKVLLTHSCTAALELAALLLDLKEGDEVILPSFTFVSTANALCLRGAVPVFVDIRPDTLNLDEKLIEGAVTSRTRAILPVHYAGVGCDMDAILSIARKHKVAVIEDAAQGLMSSYKGRPLGAIGHLGAYSFHETKNVISGEGGAILVNDANLVERAEIMREKGTDRSRFFRGQVDKYTWQDLGSSFLPGEVVAAFLWAQLENAENITAARMRSWALYNEMLAPLEERELLKRPTIPVDCEHNAHMYYVLLNASMPRQTVLRELNDRGVNAVFHYVPLHSSPAGLRYGRSHGDLKNTDSCSERLIRLPLWMGIGEERITRVVSTLGAILGA